MNRAEHVAWAKQRALEYLDGGGPNDIHLAMASLGSDLRKHPDTEHHAAIELGMTEMMAGGLNTRELVREFIKGVL